MKVLAPLAALLAALILIFTSPVHASGATFAAAVAGSGFVAPCDGDGDGGEDGATLATSAAVNRPAGATACDGDGTCDGDEKDGRTGGQPLRCRTS